jgi:imidazolonepropionase-like amidohydrolase
MGLGDTRGTVEVGKAADLLVLEASPLEDIHNTQRIRMTVADGRVVLPY